MAYIHTVPPMLCTPKRFPAKSAADKTRDHLEFHAGCCRAEHGRFSGVANVDITCGETSAEHLVIAN
jgi:hypothetical protein